MLHLSHCISTAQRSQARENPVAPEGELGVIWCWRIRVDKQEHVGSIPRSIGLNLISIEQSVLKISATYFLIKVDARSALAFTRTEEVPQVDVLPIE
jgi:hypothetical protein